MKSVFIIISLSFCLVFTLSAFGSISTIRCGSRLVSVGDGKQEVLKKCGKPDQVIYREKGHGSYIFKLYDYEKDRYIAPKMLKGPIEVELWTYDFGPTGFNRRLRFENGRLTEIETLEK